MLLIVVATGVAGFAASAVLLRLGTWSMPLRYVLATLLAYAVFLLLVRLWAEYQRRRLADFAVDVADAAIDAIPYPDGGGAGVEPWSGGEGRFGGGGAGRSWGVADAADVEVEPAPVAAVRAADGGGSWFDLDVDDAWVVVVPLVLVVGGIVAAASLLYAAPMLLAEVLLDVVLVSGLYRRLRKVEPQSWLATAVRRTWIPVVGVTLLLAAGGWAVQRAVPQADSIGDVFQRPSR
jgi:hypothetical protein